MQWGLTQTRGWIVEMAVPGTVRTVGMLLEPELLQQVQKAAATHGAGVAAWLRHALRQVTTEASRKAGVQEWPASGRMTRKPMVSASCCG